MSDLTLSPVLTSAGMAAVAAADGQGFQVKITAVAIGDGAYDIRDGDGYPLAAAKAKTELDSEQIRTDVYAGAVTGPQQVVVEARIDAGNPNFWVKEIGFFLDDGTLFAVWSSATDNLGYRGGLVPWVFRFVLSWTQLPDGAVTVEFNGDAAYADISGRLTDHMNDPLAHPDIRTDLLPVGVILPCPSQTPFDGTLVLDGALLSRTDFPGLWTYAQTSGNLIDEADWSLPTSGSFSKGDGATTFRLPDLRGVGLRGFDGGRGLDTGRIFGSYQPDEFKSHKHRFIDEYGTASDKFVARSAMNTEGIDFQTESGSRADSFIYMENTGGSETRMKNTAVNFCIKY